MTTRSRVDDDGKDKDEKEKQTQKNTYSSQLLVACPELRLVPRVRPAAHQDLLAPIDPPLCRRLSEVDLLALVSACVGVEIDPEGNK